ncbi:U3 snoRNP protein [Recurvomyces mirabilis]|uniref:U3 snoRNP protein n=1 Tax=Recurvomyces mirabilis TaxID=574656 RepID=A0AAE0TTT0_9PEZI|nr:U3 snoRNP protein [Recurvomyces mirabilis]KAK5158575.1 U3 snoRNP protein [Recurvomyces mirabilis]
MLKVKERKQAKQQLRQQDESDDSDVEFVLDGEPERDESEQELERVVFGDSAGFRQGLKDVVLVDVDEDEESKIPTTGLEELDDADLFFTDTGDSVPQATVEPDSDEEDKTLHSKHAPAWEDSDDERTLVSLAAAPRLRKLRRTEAEDVVDGREYSKRLRRQFELLNPQPEWAQYAVQQPARKKRRLSDDEGSSNDDMDIDSDDIPSVTPLSKLLQSSSDLLRPSNPSKKRKLRPEVISIQRTKDIMATSPSAITSLSFHPTLPLVLSSGPSATLYLHQLAASPPALAPNPLLTSLHIRKTALTTTAFHPTDSRIFLSARRRYFHVWNLQTGHVEKIARVYGQQYEQRSMERFKLSPDGKLMALLGSARKGGGVINVLSASTLQWVAQVRVESRGGVAEFCWWRDGKGLCIVGKSGEVTEWNAQTRTVVARWQDEGAVGTTTLTLGGLHEFAKSPIGTDRWVVIGSSSGIVNIYDRRAWLADPIISGTVPITPKPTRVLDHLTTPISHLHIDPSGQILAMASRWKRDALRLVHLPSCTVFRNWPTGETPLGRISAVSWCDGGAVDGRRGGEGGGVEGGGDVVALLAVGNEKGAVRVWEVR